MIVLRQAGLATSKDLRAASARSRAAVARSSSWRRRAACLPRVAPRFDGAYVLAKRRHRFRDARMRRGETLESAQGARIVLRVEEAARMVDGLDGAVFVFLASAVRRVRCAPGLIACASTCEGSRINTA